jgi:ribosome biogenesis protein Nip4
VKELKDFLASINAGYEPAGAMVNLNNRRFSVGAELEAHIHDKGRMVYVGKLLGRTKGEFIPSAGLIRELSRTQGPNKVWVDEKVGWLFACGRDIFVENITRSEGEMVEGACFLVMMGDDCLGYGRFETRDGRRIVANILDLGDFLRRERGLEE